MDLRKMTQSEGWEPHLPEDEAQSVMGTASLKDEKVLEYTTTTSRGLLRPREVLVYFYLHKSHAREFISEGLPVGVRFTMQGPHGLGLGSPQFSHNVLRALLLDPNDPLQLPMNVVMLCRVPVSLLSHVPGSEGKVFQVNESYMHVLGGDQWSRLPPSAIFASFFVDHKSPPSIDEETKGRLLEAEIKDEETRVTIAASLGPPVLSEKGVRQLEVDHEALRSELNLEIDAKQAAITTLQDALEMQVLENHVRVLSITLGG